MGLKEWVAGWMQRHPDVGEKVDDAVSGWLAKQPGLDHLEVAFTCSACNHTWSKTLDLTKVKLSDAILECLHCPMCGSEKVKPVR